MPMAISPAKRDALALLPLAALPGVGPKLAEKLEKLGLYTLQDLLFHLPLRYQDRTRIYPIGHLQPPQWVTVEGEVVSADIKFGRKRMLVVRLADRSGRLTLRFFTFAGAQREGFVAGRKVRAFGEVRQGPTGAEMVHPEYRVAEPGAELPPVAETLTPIYPMTEGLSQQAVRRLVELALKRLAEQPLHDPLPPALRPGGIELNQALRLLHQPTPDLAVMRLEAGDYPAQRRLILEELAAHQLSLLKLRAESDRLRAPPLAAANALKQQLLAGLPFSPTGAQSRVVAEIEADLARSKPMMRLVQGDVGSGKTLVAALAALTAIGNGYQVAVMAPTELLAEQHALNFGQWLAPLGLTVMPLMGKQGSKSRREVLTAIAEGSAQLVTGTHALFQQQVQFARLGLVIIDEQHRFGVHQRLALREKGEEAGLAPHQLIMTATPIPRTLAMTAYADLDLSAIDELPPGRTPVTTVAIPDSRRPEVVERVYAACVNEGKQAYWVCTLIEESEVLQCQAAEATAEQLAAELPQLRIGLVHGRLKAADKQAVMAAFKAGELDLLVATTVIEVGVDVPNASLMIIENPERLGLAQLHQLRGRVGRGSVVSHCVLLFHAPLSKTATARLAVLRESNDGFVIAQRDLEIRGPGELLGTRQTGLAELRIADLARDSALIPVAQELAHQLSRDPAVAELLIERWLPRRLQYGQA